MVWEPQPHPRLFLCAGERDAVEILRRPLGSGATACVVTRVRSIDAFTEPQSVFLVPEPMEVWAARSFFNERFCNLYRLRSWS
jgi:hypothetical protein